MSEFGLRKLSSRLAMDQEALGWIRNNGIRLWCFYTALRPTERGGRERKLLCVGAQPSCLVAMYHNTAAYHRYYAGNKISYVKSLFLFSYLSLFYIVPQYTLNFHLLFLSIGQYNSTQNISTLPCFPQLKATFSCGQNLLFYLGRRRIPTFKHLYSTQGRQKTKTGKTRLTVI